MRGAILLLGLIACIQNATADGISARSTLEIEQKLAMGLNDAEANQALFAVRPTVKAKFTRHWSADVSLRFEAAGSNTGLGTTETYADHSAPVELGPDARAEIDKAVLSWRNRRTRVQLGKQTVAWGVLDGLQVTDRFDAVRRREAAFIDQRPDRISRWGARAQFSQAGVQWDAAILLDGTADQLAEPEDTFAASSPRFRAGLPTGAPLPPLRVRTANQPTVGLRGSKRLGQHDVGVLLIHGPDTEPVFEAKDTSVEVNYGERTLLGATWQTSAGPRVFRTEFAWVPDQPVNVQSSMPLTDRRNRIIAGIGVDWDLPNEVFLNAQLGSDWIQGNDDLVRPNVDTIATVRLQKSWANDTVQTKAELLSSLNEGDGTIRPSVSWQASDTFRIEGGVDVIWGKETGLFGQFEDKDRAWVRATWSI